jgi:hypothetical protein
VRDHDTTAVCRTDRLYHYLLGGEDAIPAILEQGLLPLSALPESERWRRIEAERTGFFRDLYTTFALPVLQRPFRHSGVFLTPIDFRLLPDLPLASTARITLPLTAIECQHATLTYELGGQRVVRPLAPETLEQTARAWPASRVRAWFGRDQSRLFFYVPQVAVYQDGTIPVRPDWIEPPIRPSE